MKDKKWSLFHKQLAKEYPDKSKKEINKIEAGIKRARGWKPKRGIKRKRK